MTDEANKNEDQEPDYSKGQWQKCASLTCSEVFRYANKKCPACNKAVIRRKNPKIEDIVKATFAIQRKLAEKPDTSVSDLRVDPVDPIKIMEAKNQKESWELTQKFQSAEKENAKYSGLTDAQLKKVFDKVKQLTK